jgi:hypothetical protein
MQRPYSKHIAFFVTYNWIQKATRVFVPGWCHDTQLNDIQPNNIQRNDTQHNDIQYNNKLNTTLRKTTLSIKLICCQSAVMLGVNYAECRKQAHYAE